MVKFQLRHGNDLLAMDCIRNCDVSISNILQAREDLGRGCPPNLCLVHESFAIHTIFNLSYTAPKRLQIKLKRHINGRF